MRFIPFFRRSQVTKPDLTAKSLAERPDFRVDYAQGGWNEAAIMGWVSAHSERLIEAIAAHNADIDDFTVLERPAAPQLMAVLEGAEARMQAAADNASARLPGAHDALKRAEMSLKVFQLEQQIARPPKRVDGMQNTSVLGFMVILEGITTSVFFLSGGFVSGIAEALGLGLSISGANILLSALVGGNCFGRYWNYGLGARGPVALRARAKRLFSRIGAVITAAAIAALLGASGIVRATGEPEHLEFTLEALSTAATDFHSLMLWMVGASFSVLAWRKGLSLFSDPVPGYGEVSKAVHDAQDDLETLRDDALSAIEDAFEDGRDEIEDLAADASDAREDQRDQYRAVLENHNTLSGAIDQFAAACEAKIAEENHDARLYGGQPGVDIALPKTLSARLKSMMKAVPQNSESSETESVSTAAASLDLLAASRSKATRQVLDASRPPLPNLDEEIFGNEAPF